MKDRRAPAWSWWAKLPETRKTFKATLLWDQRENCWIAGCLEEAGLDRRQIYVTNAVKHFKWEPAGKRRLHKKPSAREIAACKPWLEAELDLVRPELVVALGATAAQALMGPTFRVTKDRGRILAYHDIPFMATTHPSSLLRGPADEPEKQMRGFISDLRKTTTYLRHSAEKKEQFRLKIIRMNNTLGMCLLLPTRFFNFVNSWRSALVRIHFQKMGFIPRVTMPWIRLEFLGPRLRKSFPRMP